MCFDVFSSPLLFPALIRLIDELDLKLLTHGDRDVMPIIYFLKWSSIWLDRWTDWFPTAYSIEMMAVPSQAAMCHRLSSDCGKCV
jgi:hypothetical protein